MEKELRDYFPMASRCDVNRLAKLQKKVFLKVMVLTLEAQKLLIHLVEKE